VGDINVDLSKIGENRRNVEIVAVFASFGLLDLTKQFWQPIKHQNRWTWKAKREGRMVRSRSDVVMGTDWRFIQPVKILLPPTFVSDHYALTVRMNTSIAAEQKAYLRGRRHMPNTYDATLARETRAADAQFGQLLKLKVNTRPAGQPARHDWISKETHDLMDKRTRLQKRHALR